MSELRIGKPYITHDNSKTRLNTELYLDGCKIYNVWYEFAGEYKNYICCERADGILLNVLLYAMEHGYDIRCDVPLSERLYYQLTTYLIPAISSHIDEYRQISIHADLSGEVIENVNGVGASLSGGVDSFYTLFKHYNRPEKRYNITHLTFFNAGASGEYGGDEARNRYLERIDWIKGVATKLNLKLVTVDTNINEFLQENHEATHTFRTLSLVFLLQKLFSVYYFASGVPFESFAYKYFDTAPYDLLSAKCLSTDNLTIYISGGEVNRLEKIRYIADFPLTYEYLNVCVSEAVNCSKCAKCQRTMMELYTLGMLDKYAKVFDVDYFQRHKKDYLYSTVVNKLEYDWIDIYPILKKRGEFPVPVRMRAAARNVYNIARRQLASVPLLKKLYRNFIKRG